MKYESVEGISVVMPTYKQTAFIARAICSLFMQTFKKWELIIVIDGCEETKAFIQHFLHDKRIKCIENPFNVGLGASLNIGMSLASYSLISYLPSDDIFYKDHLQQLHNSLLNEQATSCISGVNSFFDKFDIDHYGENSLRELDGYTIQLVQVLHRKNTQFWKERTEVETDDLNKMYWAVLFENTELIAYTNVITCEWTNHPLQRYKLINEFFGGGIYKFKKHYGINTPIRFQSRHGNLIDEVKYFIDFRSPFRSSKQGLKILLVGDLSYNPERICSLEEHGHNLYGLWLPNPSNHTTVGPLPFGNVIDIEYEQWWVKVKEIGIDIIYAQSNHHSISIAHEVLLKCREIPLVLQIKEGPFDARRTGVWDKLFALYQHAEGFIFHHDFMRNWYGQFVNFKKSNYLIMDGELPAGKWFTDRQNRLLSDIDGEIHTVFAGRPVGLKYEDICQLVNEKIHLHFYGELFHTAYGDLLNGANLENCGYIHLHPNCEPNDWVEEFSKYDAGWLHLFKSENNGELIRANWLDLNIPARFSTYAMSGIPVIQYDNSGHLVASQSLASDMEVGVFINSLSDLKDIIKDRRHMLHLRNNMWKSRNQFCFDYHVERLNALFYKILKDRNDERN